ncbi:KLH31 protein, partial [Amia calva]|nr:KLH31 protein [Amia calva]
MSRPEHSAAMLEELSRMRQERFLTDLELATKTKSFDVHRLVVASCSQYLRQLLEKDPELRRVELPSLSPLGLATVITFAYLGRAHLSLYTIGCTVAAAKLLQVPQLLQMCVDFLLQELSLPTCVYVWNMGGAYGLAAVREAARSFLLRHFAEFSRTPPFTQLTLEQICTFLQDDRLQLPSEVTAFQIALRWLEFDERRTRHAGELLALVRLETIPAAQLVSEVQAEPRMMLDPVCHRLLVDAMNYHLLPHQQNALQGPRTRVRAGRIVEEGDPPPAWRALTQLPAKSFNQSVAAMDGFLYVAGGEDQNDARNQAKHAVNTFCRYDPRFNTWLHLAGMSQRRTHFCLAASEGRLYAVGGRSADGVLSTVECYIPSSNAWQPRATMPISRCCHAATTLPSGSLLVTGGYSGGAYSRSVLSYSPAADAWEDCPSLATPRGWHCAALLGGRVYVVGGSQLGSRGERVDVLEVEVYCPESAQWSHAAPLSLGVSTAGLAPLGGRVGGWNEAEKKYQSAVQRYDPDSDSWGTGGQLPEPTVGVSCCALTLPPQPPPPAPHKTGEQEEERDVGNQDKAVPLREE